MMEKKKKSPGTKPKQGRKITAYLSKRLSLGQSGHNLDTFSGVPNIQQTLMSCPYSNTTGLAKFVLGVAFNVNEAILIISLTLHRLITCTTVPPRYFGLAVAATISPISLSSIDPCAEIALLLGLICTAPLFFFVRIVMISAAKCVYCIVIMPTFMIVDDALSATATHRRVINSYHDQNISRPSSDWPLQKIT